MMKKKTFAFVLLLTVATQDHRFVLDHKLSFGDCYSLLKKARNTGQRFDNRFAVANTYLCEKED